MSAVAQPGSTEKTFDRYTPLAGNAALVQRTLSPLTRARVERELAAGHSALAAEPIDLAKERFRVFLPDRHGPAGYGLIVFIPPWEDDRVPAGWADVLQRAGFILATAQHSGNSQTLLGRRLPLAILAAYNIERHFPVDLNRVYVAGFSGGARAAFRVALAYPDVFRGGILDAGSDAPGAATLPLPSPPLFDAFRGGSRLVFVTGESDAALRMNDARTIDALAELCGPAHLAFIVPRLGHEIMPAAALARALDFLNGPRSPASPTDDPCAQRISAAIEGELDGVQQMVARGELAAAKGRLGKIDRRWGGLAAPRSVEIFDEIQGR